MKKIAWLGLLIFVLADVAVISLAPSAEKVCCKKMCAPHKGDKLNFRILYKSDGECCKKGDCHKVAAL